MATDKDKVLQARAKALSSVVNEKMNDYRNIRQEISKWCEAHKYSVTDSIQHDLAVQIIQGTDIKAEIAKELFKETEDDSTKWLEVK